MKKFLFLLVLMTFSNCSEDLSNNTPGFEASVNGELYDPEAWGNYYRPAGVQIDTSNSAPKTESATVAPTPQPAPAPVAETPAPVTPPQKQEAVAQAVAATAPASVDAEKPSAQDILAAIRNRNNG